MSGWQAAIRRVSEMMTERATRGEPSDSIRIDFDRQLGQRLVDLEVTVGGSTAGVHHALGNALVVEMRDLLAKYEIFQE
jgi:hypothetical protein